MNELLWFELDCFEKSEDGDKSRKIGGYASTEHLDRQNEILIQKGLDFSEFLSHGWFNDDHDKTTSGVVGYPTKAEFHEGKGWYVEGYLVKGYKRADDIWELAKSLQKSGERRLGFSVQGSSVKRDGNKIVKAMISQVAITHCPVNPNCKMDVLTKSFCPHATEACFQHEDCCKSLEAGYEASTNMEGGAALRKQSIDKDLKVENLGAEEEVKKCKKTGKPCDGSCHKSMDNDIKTEKSILIGDEIIDEISKRGYNESQVQMIYNKFKELGYITTTTNEQES